MVAECSASSGKSLLRKSSSKVSGTLSTAPIPLPHWAQQGACRPRNDVRDWPLRSRFDQVITCSGRSTRAAPTTGLKGSRPLTWRPNPSPPAKAVSTRVQQRALGLLGSLSSYAHAPCQVVARGLDGEVPSSGILPCRGSLSCGGRSLVTTGDRRQADNERTRR
jgi:hypothetical protein